MRFGHLRFEFKHAMQCRHGVIELFCMQHHNRLLEAAIDFACSGFGLVRQGRSHGIGGAL